MMPNEPRTTNEPRASQPAPEKQGTIAAQLRQVWRVAGNHPWLKISALLLAMLFWSVLIASDENIKREKVIVDAVVNVSGLETLQARGLTITEDLSANPIKVRMRVSVAQRDYQTASGANFMPRLDLARITQAGDSQEIKFSQAIMTYGTVLEFIPSSYTVNVETYDQRGRIPVEVVPIGKASTPLWFDKPVTDPAQITVSGPHSLVNQVARAVVYLPIDSLDISRTHNSMSALIELQDRDGGPVDSSMLRISSELVNMQSVRVDVDVYPMKELPIDTSIAVRGTPAHGYEISRTMMVPQSVQVAGPQAVLDRLQTIYVETPIDVSNMDEAVQGRSGLRLAPELKYSSATEVVILAAVREAVHTHTYVNIPVEIRNADAMLSADLALSEMSVTISGPYLTMERVSAEDVHLFVDAAGLTAGESVLPIQCMVDNVSGFTFTPQQPEVLLTLTERPPVSSSTVSEL
ncbi:hypothetical protein AGMMS49992_20810 [Clostridia bacterium]|nr:hypothetical protein AGMMS49992_20810 [Clostridia bacterium]